MSDEELRKYYTFFTEVWKFFKKYHSPKTEDEWDAAIEDGDELAKTSPFRSETKHTYSNGVHMTNNGTEMIMLIMAEIERLAQEKNNEN